jgi:hypothetical protein
VKGRANIQKSRSEFMPAVLWNFPGGADKG